MEHKKSSEGSNHDVPGSSDAIKSVQVVPNCNAVEKMTDSSKLGVVNHGDQHRNGKQDFQFPTAHDDPVLISDGTHVTELHNQSTSDSKKNVIPLINHDMERLNSSGNSSIDHDPFACIFSEISVPIDIQLMRGTSYEGEVVKTETNKAITLGDTIQKGTINKSTDASNFHLDGVSEDLLSFAHASSFPSLMTETFDERDHKNRDYFSPEICLDGPGNGKRSKESFARTDDLSTRTAFTPAQPPTAQEKLDGCDSITDGLTDGTTCVRTHSETADGSNSQEIGRAKKPTGTIKTEIHETVLQLTDDDRLEIDGNVEVFSLVRNISPQRVHAISESQSEVTDQSNAHAPAHALDAISAVNAEDTMLFSFPELSSTIFEDEELRFEERVDGVSPLTLMTSGANSPMKVSSTTPKRNTSSHSGGSGDGVHSAVGSIPVGDIFLPLPFPDAMIAEDTLLSESFLAAVTPNLMTGGNADDMDSKCKSTLSGMLGSPPGAVLSDISNIGCEADQTQTQRASSSSTSTSSFSPLDGSAVLGLGSVSGASITHPSQSIVPSVPHVPTPISAFSALGTDTVGAALLPVHAASPPKTPDLPQRDSASHVLMDQGLASSKAGAGKGPPVAPLDPASPAPVLVGSGSSSIAIVTDDIYAFSTAVEPVRIERTESLQGSEEHVVSDDWGGFNDSVLVPDSTHVTTEASCALLIGDTDIDVWSSAADFNLVTADKDRADLSAVSELVEEIEPSRIKSSENTERSDIMTNMPPVSALIDATIPAFVENDGVAKEKSRTESLGNALLVGDVVETVATDKPAEMLAVIEDEVENGKDEVENGKHEVAKDGAERVEVENGKDEVAKDGAERVEVENGKDEVAKDGAERVEVENGKDEVAKDGAERVEVVKVEEVEVVKRGGEVVATKDGEEEEVEKVRVEKVVVVERVGEAEKAKEEEEEEDEWDDFEEADVLPTAHSAVLSPMSNAILPLSFDAPSPQRGVMSTAVESSSTRFTESISSSSDEAAKEAESLFHSSERAPGQVSGLNVRHLS
jgi:hypothetical protein